MASVTGPPPPAPAEPAPAWHRFRPGGPLTGDAGLTTTTRSASPQQPSRSLRLPGRVAQETILAEPSAPQYMAMTARHVDSAGHEIVAYNVASADDDPAVAPSRERDVLAVIREPDWQPHISMPDFASGLAGLRRSTGSPAVLPDGWG
jgi:hypothetical protein